MKYLVQSKMVLRELLSIICSSVFKNLSLCPIFIKIISVEKVVHLISSKHISYIHYIDYVLYKYFLISFHFELLSRSWT